METKAIFQNLIDILTKTELIVNLKNSLKFKFVMLTISDLRRL